MTSFTALITFVFISATAFQSCRVRGNFYKDTYCNWGASHSHIFGNGDDVDLMLDSVSGSGVESNKSYLFGSVELQIKLVPGNAAGTVMAYYLSSTGDYHDEIDFEFLGNTSGEPYTIHTNLFIQGKAEREQQFRFWFDPTSDFHNYTIHWNPDLIVWYVDSIPIRIYRNYKNEGIGFPDQQEMHAYSSLWNGDNWATRAGEVKIDWSYAPFKASLRNFKARACEWKGPISIKRCAKSNQANWWTSPVYKQLSLHERNQLKWVRDNYMVYNYCADHWRFNSQMAPECSKPQY